MEKKYFQLLALSSLTLMMVGCSTQESQKSKTGTGNSSESQQIQENNSKSEKKITKAVAVLSPTKDNKAHGMVAFTMTADGVKVVADIEGLTPGKHGFHIHEKGDCSAPDASSAGGHFNPNNHHHGAPDAKDRHVGDLGNITADENGIAHYERVDPIIAFDGESSIIGRSVIVHEKEDDFTTQPTGNSGARIACGVIESAE